MIRVAKGDAHDFTAQFYRSVKANSSHTPLEITEKTLGKEHPNYARNLSYIASNYYSLGDYNKALEYNLIALEIYEKTQSCKNIFFGLI